MCLDLVTIGNISIDSIKIGDMRKLTRPGGSPAAVATAASALNLKTGIVSQVGKDFKKSWLDELKSKTIDLSGITNCALSCRFEMHYDSKGNMHKFDEIFNVEDALSVNTIPSKYLKAKHIHLAAAHPKNQARFLKAKSLKKPTVSLTLWPAYEKEYNDSFIKLLENVDILFCNQHEANMLASEDNIYDSVKKIKGPKLIALTKGHRGAAVYCRDCRNQFSLFPALRSSTLDRTGCGDAFAGGFLAEYIRSRDVEKAGWAGTALASFTLSKVGAWFPHEVTFEDIEKRIERAKKYSNSNVKKGTLLDFF